MYSEQIIKVGLIVEFFNQERGLADPANTVGVRIKTR